MKTDLRKNIKIKKNKKCKIPDQFPLFKDWSEQKLTFMSMLSSLDYCENYCEDEIIPDEESVTIEPQFTIATDYLYETNESGKCHICEEQINIEYKEEIEEWIYPECTVMDNIHVVHILCYDLYLNNI